MAYRIKDPASCQKYLRAIGVDQFEKTIAQIDDPKRDVHETIHEVRKRCKKVRALLRLFRKSLVGNTYSDENACLRDAARTLSDARDATAMVETYDALLDAYDDVDRRPFSTIRRKLTFRKKHLLENDGDLTSRIHAFRKTMQDALKRARKWKIDDEGFAAVAGGLKKTYARGRDAMRACMDEPTDENLHEWRKRAKYHRYHVRILREPWRGMMNARRRQMHDLTDYLGDDHDLVVLRKALLDEPEHFGDPDALQDFIGLLDGRRTQLQAAAFTLGQRLYVDKPSRYVDRLGTYWKAWQEEVSRGPLETIEAS